MDSIVFEYNGVEMDGILVQEYEDELTIKLQSGYNIILNKKSVKILKREKNENKKYKTKEQKNISKNKILVLHTGGTIAGSIDYSTGAVSNKFTPSDLLNLFPEVLNLASIDSRLVDNIASDDMRFSHYNLLLNEIKKNSSKYDGIIITHGTDTLHYTSVALQYGLDNLSIPVLVVGAQRSSDRPSSDAFLNFVSAIKFIVFNKGLKENGKGSFNRVGVCMHANENDDDCVILDGINVKKLHSSERGAFKSINKKPVALVNYGKNMVKILEESYFINVDTGKKLIVNKYNEDLKIGIVRIHPQFFPEELNIYLKEKYDGLIIEGTGLGHLPITDNNQTGKIHGSIFKVLKSLVARIPVVMTTQTVYGVVNMNVYTPGRILQDIGVIGNMKDYSTETAFIRLGYLLSKYIGKNNCIELVKEDY